MAYNKFNQTNNAHLIPISVNFTDSDTTMILDTGYGALLPTDNFKFTVELFTNDVVTKREVINVATRTGDTLSGITRATEACVQDDSLTPRVSTSNTLDFSGTAYASLRDTAGDNEDLKDEVTRIVNVDVAWLETNKLDIADYISNEKKYSTSYTGTDAYQITLADYTSYVDGIVVFFKTDVANTASATLEINALGAKDLLKFNDRPLETGDLEAWMICQCAFNSSDDAWTVLSTISDYSSNIIVDNLSKEVVLGETVTAWDGQGAVYFGEGIANTQVVQVYTPTTSSNIWEIGSNQKFGIIFTPEINMNIDTFVNLKLQLRKVWSPTDNIQINLYASNKTTAISGFTQQIIDGSTLDTTYTREDIPGQTAELVEGTEYFLEISRSGVVDNSNYYQIGITSSDTILWYGYSTYDWSAWTDSDNETAFIMQYGKVNTVGKVRLSDDRYQDTNKSDLIIVESWTADQTKKGIMSGLLTQSWVDEGSLYYLNNDDSELEWVMTNYKQLGHNLNTSYSAYIQRYATSFIIDQSILVSEITLKANTTAFTPSLTNLTVRIETDNAWVPSWTLVDSNAIWNGAYTSSAWADNTLAFSGQFTLNAATKYWIYIDHPTGLWQSGTKREFSSSTYTDMETYHWNGSSYDLLSATQYFLFTVDSIPAYTMVEPFTLTSTGNVTSTFDYYNQNNFMWFFSTALPLVHSPFLIWKGSTTSKINLMIENNNYHKLINPDLVVPWETYSLVSAPTLKWTNSQTYILVKKVVVGEIQNAYRIIPWPYNVQISYYWYASGSWATGYFETYVNWELVNSWTVGIVAYPWTQNARTETLSDGDVIEVYYHTTPSDSANIHSFLVSYDLERDVIESSMVILD